MSKAPSKAKSQATSSKASLINPICGETYIVTAGTDHAATDKKRAAATAMSCHPFVIFIFAYCAKATARRNPTPKPRAPSNITIASPNFN